MSTGREREKRAFQFILEAGEEGLMQSDMWKQLGANSQMGSTIAQKLERKDIIKRLRVLHDGRWTYRLFSIKKPVTIESIMDCPCMNCEDIEKCTPGRFISPDLCEKLTYWIDFTQTLG
ncbi:unnamed protein product, partial [marine sediment metagenome]